MKTSSRTGLSNLIVSTLLALSACGDGASGSKNDKSVYQDTPQTRLEAVRNQRTFATLIAEPDCRSDRQEVSTDLHAGSYLFRSTDADGTSFSCYATVQILIDSRTGMLIWIEKCDDPNSTSIYQTSRYSIDGDRLVVEDLGTLRSSTSGGYSLETPRSASGTASLHRTGTIQTKSTAPELYETLCGD